MSSTAPIWKGRLVKVRHRMMISERTMVVEVLARRFRVARNDLMSHRVELGGAVGLLLVCAAHSSRGLCMYQTRPASEDFRQSCSVQYAVKSNNVCVL
ncbi:hypothetical protein L6452_17010 [Arctium lappa]|uniref:Uncharacterized protein n=1 Tax=Arctium lappa TaxID=4217 RepID=A0ACB9C237_ARCLA|nr:hypothetical protein L6452_17010 [Arctium lappa]